MADEHTTAFAGAGLPTCKALRKVCETFSFLKVDQYLGQTLHALSGWRELMVVWFGMEYDIPEQVISTLIGIDWMAVGRPTGW